jgi:hypothetical protein
MNISAVLADIRAYLNLLFLKLRLAGSCEVGYRLIAIMRSFAASADKRRFAGIP